MAGTRKDEFVSVDEVAARYRVGRRTVFRLIAERRVQRMKVPGDRRTHISTADAAALFQPVNVDARRRR